MSSAQRRLLTWGLIAIALVAAIAVAASLVRRTVGALGLGPPAPAHISQDVVVERVRAVAKLVATEMTLRDVVTYEQTQYRSTKKALLVVTARVAAGIDLSQGTAVSIDSVAKRITVSLPPSQIMSVDVLNVTTYDERAGLWNPFRPEDRDAMQRLVRARLLETAKQSGALEHADRNAAAVLTDLLARDGYTVEIRRPPVQAKPGG